MTSLSGVSRPFLSSMAMPDRQVYRSYVVRLHWRWYLVRRRLPLCRYVFACLPVLRLTAAYLFWCSVVFGIAQCQLEIVTMFPLDGSFIRLAGRMVDPAFGVAAGWNHFFAQASYVIFEATIINTLVEYWGYDQSPAILISISLALYFALNIWRADLFGEAECECSKQSDRGTSADASLDRAWQTRARRWAHVLHPDHDVRRESYGRVRALRRGGTRLTDQQVRIP